MKKQFIFRQLVLSLAVILSANLADAASEYALFNAGPQLHRISKDTKRSGSLLFPLCENRISKCLPGSLYDVRELFTSIGIIFKKNDFAWYHPKSQYLIVYAPRQQLDLIEIAIAVPRCTNPPATFILDAKISISSPDSTKSKKPIEALLLKSYSNSGHRLLMTATTKNGIGYKWEFEGVAGPSGLTLNYAMVMTINYRKREYSSTNSAVLYPGNEHSYLLGQTLDGRNVQLHLKAKTEQMNLSKQKQFIDSRLLECIREQLDNPPTKISLPETSNDS